MNIFVLRKNVDAWLVNQMPLTWDGGDQPIGMDDVGLAVVKPEHGDDGLAAVKPEHPEQSGRSRTDATVRWLQTVCVESPAN